MNKVKTDVDLLPYNTFKISSKAKYFLELNSQEDIFNIPENKSSFVLGMGANTLFTNDFDGLIIKNNLFGKKQIEEGTFEVASGENWHEFVMYTVEQGWSGIENLAYIPGTVGAARYKI